MNIFIKYLWWLPLEFFDNVSNHGIFLGKGLYFLCTFIFPAVLVEILNRLEFPAGIPFAILIGYIGILFTIQGVDDLKKTRTTVNGISVEGAAFYDGIIITFFAAALCVAYTADMFFETHYIRSAANDLHEFFFDMID